MIPPHVHSSNYHHIDQRHSGAAPDPNPSPSPSPSPSRCHWPDTGADPGHNNPLLGSGTAAILNPNPHGYNPNPGLGHNPNYSAILRVYFDPSSSSSSSSKPVHHIERHEIRDPDWGSDAMLHYGAGNPAAAAHVLYGHGQSSGAGMAASAAPGPGLVAEYKYKPSGNISLLGPTEAAAPSPHSSSPSLDAGISQEYSCSHVDSLNLLPLIPGAMAMEAAADPAGNHSDLLRGLQSNPNPNPNPNPNLLRGLQSNPNPNPNPNPNFNPNPNLNPNLNPNPSTNPNPNHVSYANYAALLAGMAGAGGELGLSPTTYAAPLQPTVIDLYNHQQQSNRHMIMLSPMQMRHETSNSIMQEAAQLCGLHNLSPALHSGTLGLNLGGRTYFSSDDLALGRLIGSKRLRPVLDHRHGYMMSSYHDDELHHHELSPSALGLGFGMASAKTVQVHHQAMAAPLCQAEGCKADLSLAKHYHRRHKVCEYHSKASTVQVGAQTQRFCQQCSRFHMLAEFDDGKRSCRKRLADHNRRRRKPAAPSAFMTSTVVAGAGVGVGPANTSPGSWAGPGGPADNANGQAEGNETAHVAGQPGPGQPRDMARDSSVSSGSSSSNSGGGGGGGSENGC